MKIEVGKTYNSTVAAYTKPGIGPEESRRVPEQWNILASYFVDNQWKFVGRYVAQDGVVMVREFDEEGRDGTTKSGNSRNLLPNTKTVVEWGIVQVGDRAFYANSKREGNTQEAAQRRIPLSVVGKYTTGFVTYQVEE